MDGNEGNRFALAGSSFRADGSPRAKNFDEHTDENGNFSA